LDPLWRTPRTPSSPLKVGRRGSRSEARTADQDPPTLSIPRLRGGKAPRGLWAALRSVWWSPSLRQQADDANEQEYCAAFRARSLPLRASASPVRRRTHRAAVPSIWRAAGKPLDHPRARGGSQVTGARERSTANVAEDCGIPGLGGPDRSLRRLHSRPRRQRDDAHDSKTADAKRTNRWPWARVFQAGGRVPHQHRTPVAVLDSHRWSAPYCLELGRGLRRARGFPLLTASEEARFSGTTTTRRAIAVGHPEFFLSRPILF